MIRYIKTKCKHFIKAILLLFSLLIWINNGSAQNNDQITVKGIVTDTANMPLIGVTVMVVETQKGVITDYNGNFSINAQMGNKLRFSYVGYKMQEVTISSSTVDIKMIEDKVNLDEVVVVAIGYGTARKSDLTGAISSVSSEKFNRGVITTSEQLIQGKIAGVTVTKGSGDPTKGADIRLRGGTSLTAGNGPLVVVDGIPGVDINTVSPNDIETMDILKDASAAAIYGSRGANGVILITTKKAKEGHLNTSYNTYVAIGTAAKNLDVLSADQFRKVMRDSANSPTYKGKMVDYGANTDWQKEIERTAISHSHNLSLDGGTDKTSYRASLTYLNNQGIVINSDLERLSGSLTVNHKALNDRLKIEASLSTTMDEYKPTNYGAFRSAYVYNPTLPVYDENGEYTKLGVLFYDNPVAQIKMTTQDESRVRLLGYTKFDLELTKGLIATVNLSTTLNSHQNRRYVNSKAPNETTNGQGQRDLDENSTRQLETYLNYTHDFNDLNLNFMGGYSYLYSKYEAFGSYIQNFATDQLLYNNLEAGTQKTATVYSDKNDSKLISFFGRANLNYKSKYMLTGTLRRDGSSKFGKNNKWGLFPSASLAWRISDEEFMEWSKPVINNLKLRFGYGLTGNQESIKPLQSVELRGQDIKVPSAYYDGATQTWKQGYVITQNPNPDLKWEQTEQFNYGIDFTLFDRINGSVEYYEKYTSDLLYEYNVPMPPYQFGVMLANVGTLANKGFEGNLNIQLFRKKNFTWNVDLNASINDQKIDKLSNSKFQTTYASSALLTNLRGVSGVYAQRIQEGYSVGTFYGPVFNGFDENGEFTFKDFDGDGKVGFKDEDDWRVLGDAQPDFTLGFGMNFGFWNFDFNFFMNGIFGQDVFNASLFDKLDESGLANDPNYNILDKALTDNYKTTKPVFCDYWIEDGSFLRMQNMTLGYTFPIKNSIWIKKARVYASVENLFVITDYSGVDPEISFNELGLDTSKPYPGIERNDNYPKPRTFSFGLNVQF